MVTEVHVQVCIIGLMAKIRHYSWPLEVDSSNRAFTVAATKQFDQAGCMLPRLIPASFQFKPGVCWRVAALPSLEHVYNSKHLPLVDSFPVSQRSYYFGINAGFR